jgi:uncharacterized protein (TIGR02678 family)
MSLASVMESERRAEGARTLRHLIATPLVLASSHPDLFAAVLRHRAWLVSWFADHAGWKLSVEPSSGFARLHKVPGTPDATRPAQLPGRGPFDRRRYALFCLVLAAFDDAGPQTTLAHLARRIEELSAEDKAMLPFDSTSGAERRAFVDALRVLVQLGVLRMRDGDTDRYAQTRQGDALFDVNERVLSHLISAPVPPAFAGDPQRLLDEPFPDTDEGLRQRHRHHVMRKLLDDPVLYFDDLEPGAFDWVDHSRGFVYRLLEADAGFIVERRQEGLAAIDPSGVTADTSFPDGGSTVKHAAILLAEQLARLHRGGARLVSSAEAVVLTRTLHRDFGESCHWSKQYPADDEGCARLTKDALELLEAFGLVALEDGGWRIRAAIARFRPGAPTSRRTR